MLTAALCYAPADAGAATELRSYLEANCPLIIEDGVMQMGANLLDAVETGLSLDYALVLLSSASVEPAWQRKRWESVLFEQPKQLGTKIAYALLEDCKFPAVLRKANFFDLARDFGNGRRSVKRWLLAESTPAAQPARLPERAAGGASADLEALETLADWPEFTRTSDRQAALEFAYARHADFEAVVWLDCTRRSHVGVLGDLAQGLGLQLEGSWEENRQALSDYCGERRLLLIFEHLEMAEMAELGGKASVVIVDVLKVKPRKSLNELSKLFSAWKRNAETCLGVLGDVESHLISPEILQDEHWEKACSLCMAAIALLKEYGRLAEAHDLLARISGAVQVRGDLALQGHVEWETSWILERWDQPLRLPGRMAAELIEPLQLSLFG